MSDRDRLERLIGIAGMLKTIPATESLQKPKRNGDRLLPQRAYAPIGPEWIFTGENSAANSSHENVWLRAPYIQLGTGIPVWC